MNENPILEIDKLIHEPARLLIIRHLSLLDSGDFLYLLAATGLSKGNLSTHLQKLEKAGYIEIKKRFVGKKPQTILKLTELGRIKYEAYQETMKKLWQNSSDT
ncbi:MAG: transcriptional regulator [Candidatus Stygibacter australis]|nr:transcriptional regulator [Candidatus Stygibacter australis]